MLNRCHYRHKQDAATSLSGTWHIRGYNNNPVYRKEINAWSMGCLCADRNRSNYCATTQLTKNILLLSYCPMALPPLGQVPDVPWPRCVELCLPAHCRLRSISRRRLMNLDLQTGRSDITLLKLSDPPENTYRRLALLNDDDRFCDGARQTP